MVWPYAVIIFFVVLDRFLKFLAVHGYFDGGVNILGDVFRLGMAQNYYIAFSLPVSGAWLNWIIGMIILGLFFYFAYLLKKDNRFLPVIVLAVALGASSNFFDRLEYGFVIDYLDLRYFTVFNLADAMIVIGVVTMFFCCIDKKEKV